MADAAEQRQLLEQEAQLYVSAAEVRAPVLRRFSWYALPALLLLAATVAAAAVGKLSGVRRFSKVSPASKLFLNDIGGNSSEDTGGNSNGDSSQLQVTTDYGYGYGSESSHGQMQPCEGNGDDGCCMSPKGPVGCDHASSGSGDSGGSEGTGEKAQSLKEFLKSNGLDVFEKGLSKLGVERKSDLQYLDKKSINELQGTYIQRKKFAALVES